MKSSLSLGYSLSLLHYLYYNSVRKFYKYYRNRSNQTNKVPMEVVETAIEKRLVLAEDVREEIGKKG